MANAFPQAGCPGSILRDFVGIGELKIVDSREQECILRELDWGSTEELKSFAKNNFGANFQSWIMPSEFDGRFYV